MDDGNLGKKCGQEDEDYRDKAESVNILTEGIE
jgi:hypothetical protein